MLIDFTVENYRSIKGPVTLSAVAEKGRGSASPSKSVGRDHIKADSDVAAAFPIAGRGFELLPALGIFGANASGKSNVLMAFDKLMDFMAQGNTAVYGPYPFILEGFVPFKLDKATAALPARFRLRSALAGTIYTYTLVVNAARVLDERLEWMPPPPRKNGLLFARSWDQSRESYAWKNGPHLQGFEKIQSAVKEYESFMSLLAMRLNVTATRPFADWASFRWPGLGLGHENLDQDRSTMRLARMGPERKAKVVEIIRRFDTAVTDIEFEEGQSVHKDGTIALHKLVAVHRQDGIDIRWPFSEESNGTQRLSALASKILSCLDQGALLLVDELGSNIHPNVTREIVRLFQDPQTNPKRAQLIFTSHDNTLLRRNLLRRDQVWFTQKREDGSTDLYPLTDFHPRNDLAVDKAYLDGRFEAVPILPRTRDILGGLPEGAEPEAIAS